MSSETAQVMTDTSSTGYVKTGYAKTEYLNTGHENSHNTIHDTSNNQDNQLVKQLMRTITLKEISEELFNASGSETSSSSKNSDNISPNQNTHSTTCLSNTLSPFSTQFRVFEGEAYDYVGQRIFGGQVLAQALMAASQTVEDGRGERKPCHSLHGYFLRGGDVRYPVLYQVQALRDGQSLSARRVTAIQYKENLQGQPVEQVIFSMIASFAPMEDGLEYQPDMPIYPPPEDLLTEQELKEQYVGNIPDALKARFMRKRHVEVKPVKPRNLIDPEPMKPKQANWLRIPHLSKAIFEQFNNQSIAAQQALLAFSSDFYLVGTGLMPHGVSFMTKGLQAASIDHSMHFHRPFDLSEWILYDMWSDNTAYAKCLNHGQFWQNGNLVATVQQEGLMRLRVK